MNEKETEKMIALLPAACVVLSSATLALIYVVVRLAVDGAFGWPNDKLGKVIAFFSNYSIMGVVLFVHYINNKKSQNKISVINKKNKRNITMPIAIGAIGSFVLIFSAFEFFNMIFMKDYLMMNDIMLQSFVIAGVCVLCAAHQKSRISVG